MADSTKGRVVAQIHDNGEVVEIAPPPHRRIKSDLSYALVTQYGSMEVAPYLTQTQHKIISMLLFDYRQDAPWARFTSAELIRELGLTSPLFYRALKPLRESGLVKKISTTTWVVNPKYAWRGSRKEWEEQLKHAGPIDTWILRRGR